MNQNQPNPKLNVPTIKEVFQLLITKQEEYGFYWVANKLEKINTPLNWGSANDGFQYSAWVSNKDANFILPKLHEKWFQGGGYYRNEIVRNYGNIEVSYKKGRNGNMCISLTFIPRQQVGAELIIK